MTDVEKPNNLNGKKMSEHYYFFLTNIIDKNDGSI